MRIAYLARVLPALSETFVVREIAALRRLGMKIKPFSIHPSEKVFNPEIPDLLAEVEVLVRPLNPIFWLAHLVLALTFPRRYWGCLYDYVLRDREHQGKFWRRWQYFAIAPFTAWRLSASGIDHVHAHFANASATVAMMAVRLAGITFSFTVHSHYEVFIDNLLLPEKLADAAGVVSVSQFYIDKLKQRYPQAAGRKIDLVRCGTDGEAFIPKAGKRNSPPVFISVGRLVDLKGFHTLIEACAALRDRGLAFECRIIGDGPELEELQHLIARLQIGDRVKLLGGLQPAEVKAAYQQADLMVLACCASKYPRELHNHDCIPVALMEAMATGLPAISTWIGGIPELIRNRETGLLVAPDDPSGLAAAMGRLLSDEGLAQQLAQAGRNYVVQEFGAQTNALRLQKIFTRIMEGKAA
ncbi:MAG: glycosyltransferase family 4 protein [Deltaproteobacteria bacterium]|nr:glycosyltransferase family 4 protein [Deltaproteobacteria bacterium]